MCLLTNEHLPGLSDISINIIHLPNFTLPCGCFCGRFVTQSNKHTLVVVDSSDHSLRTLWWIDLISSILLKIAAEAAEMHTAQV